MRSGEESARSGAAICHLGNLWAMAASKSLSECMGQVSRWTIIYLPSNCAASMTKAMW